MTIVRRDDQVALNELIVACREAANCHASAVDLLPDESLAGGLQALAKDRAAIADDLAEVVLREGDVPDAPSAESALLKTAAARVKSAIAEDETSQLLRDCREKEDRIVEAATTLLGHALEEEIRQRVSSLRTDASSRLARLQDSYASPRGS